MTGTKGMTPSFTVVPGSLAPTRGPGGEATDVELVAAARLGDDRAFERLYERYHRRIAAYIYGMVNDFGRAEEIAQDVFMSALRRMRETDRPIAFKPWVYEIAKNACIDQFRRSRRGEEISYDAEDGLGTADHGRLVTTGPSPDVAVDQKAALDHLCGAFGGLSETHHRILVMREFEGLSYREIGKQLGMSRPSVESTLFRARRRLSEEYAELTSGERCVRVQATIAGTVGSASLRDSRRLSAHLSHCQPCRRAAHAAGFQIATAPRRAVRARIAAVLPFPGLLRRRGGGDGATDLGSSHAGTVAHWSAQLGAVDPGTAGGWIKAATAAAMVAFVGVGAGEGTERLARGGERPVVAAAVPSHAAKVPARVAVRPRQTSRPGAAVTPRPRVSATQAHGTPGPASVPGRSATAGAGTQGSALTKPTSGAASPAAIQPPAANLLPLSGNSAPNAPRPSSGKPVDPKAEVPAGVPQLPAAPATPLVGETAGNVAGAVGAVAGIVAGQ